METSGLAKLLIGCLAVANAVAWFLLFSPSMLFEYRFPENYDPQKYLDALDMAVSLGRLDAISLVLTILGIFLGVAAIFGFTYLKDRVEQLSKKTTRKTVFSMFDEMRESFMEKSESGQRLLPTSNADKERGDK